MVIGWLEALELDPAGFDPPGLDPGLAAVGAGAGGLPVGEEGLSVGAALVSSGDELPGVFSLSPSVCVGSISSVSDPLCSGEESSPASVV